jgi:hypothetical protein
MRNYEKLRGSLQYYFEKNKDMPYKIEMSLKYYNVLCKEIEDETGYISIYPYESFMGVPIKVIENLSYNYKIL